MKNSTIAAIATPHGVGGISVIRISGIDSILICDKIFKAKSKKRLIDANSHTIHYGNIVSDNEVVDEVLVSVMRAPNTFTREDTVEINCHGGVLVTKKILETVILTAYGLSKLPFPLSHSHLKSIIPSGFPYSAFKFSLSYVFTIHFNIGFILYSSPKHYHCHTKSHKLSYFIF